MIPPPFAVLRRGSSSNRHRQLLGKHRSKEKAKEANEIVPLLDLRLFLCVWREREREQRNCVKWRGQVKTVQNPQPKLNPTPFFVCFALAFMIFMHYRKKRRKENSNNKMPFS